MRSIACRVNKTSFTLAFVLNDLRRQSEPAAPMTLPLSWDEWSSLDGVALAERVRAGELTATELAAQAAVGIGKVNPSLSGVIEIFDDVVSSPGKDGVNLDGSFAGLPFLMKDLGPTMKGRLQGMGSLLVRGNLAR